jgi:sugar phosphate isomerase/epimerase
MKNLLLVFMVVAATAALGQQFGKTLKETPGMVSYTYRKSFAKDVGLTLDTIKSLGVTNMEFSNLFGRTAEEIRKMLDDRGMKCTSFGVSYQDLVEKTSEVARNAKTLGATYVRVAWIPHEGAFTIDIAKKAVEDFNKVGMLLKEQFGIEFCYHNHGYEFQPYEKGTYYDYIMTHTDPEFVSFELDILWAFHPGADPAAVLKKYGPRFKLMHVKDLKKGVKGDFTGSTSQENDVAVGTGQLNIPAIMKAAKKSAIVHYYIEDESSSVNVQVPKTLAYLKKL